MTLPLLLVAEALRRFESRAVLLRDLSVAAACFVGCFPAGLLTARVLKRWAEGGCEYGGADSRGV